MRYIHRRIFSHGYRPSTVKKRKIRRMAFAAAAIFLMWKIVSEAGLSAISNELTEESVRGYLLNSINSAVNDELADRESPFVNVKRSSDGTILSVSANAAELNSLKYEVLSRLSKSLNGKTVVRVPFGSLTTIRILNGRGPSVPVKLNLESSADVSFQTEFVSAGINQSCHRITMTVRVRSFSQSRRYETAVEETTTSVLAETIVVGAVPEVALVES